MTVQEYEKKGRSCGYWTARSGYRYLHVAVVYAAAEGGSGAFYSEWDWSAVDEKRQQFEPEYCLSDGTLGAGQLNPGNVTGGWITFIVPAKAKHIYVEMRPSFLRDEVLRWKLW